MAKGGRVLLIGLVSHAADSEAYWEAYELAKMIMKLIGWP